MPDLDEEELVATRERNIGKKIIDKLIIGVDFEHDYIHKSQLLKVLNDYKNAEDLIVARDETIQAESKEILEYTKSVIKEKEADLKLHEITSFEFQEENIKLKTEINKLNKVIDKMAEYIEQEVAEYQLDEIYASLYKCNGMERNWTRGKEEELKDIKKYFIEEVENEKNNSNNKT